MACKGREGEKREGARWSTAARVEIDECNTKALSPALSVGSSCHSPSKRLREPLSPCTLHSRCLQSPGPASTVQSPPRSQPLPGSQLLRALLLQHAWTPGMPPEAEVYATRMRRRPHGPETKDRRGNCFRVIEWIPVPVTSPRPSAHLTLLSF